MLRHSAKSSAGYRGLLALGFASPWLAAYELSEQRSAIVVSKQLDDPNAQVTFTLTTGSGSDTPTTKTTNKTSGVQEKSSSALKTPQAALASASGAASTKAPAAATSSPVQVRTRHGDARTQAATAAGRYWYQTSGGRLAIFAGASAIAGIGYGLSQLWGSSASHHSDGGAACKLTPNDDAGTISASSACFKDQGPVRASFVTSHGQESAGTVNGSTRLPLNPSSFQASGPGATVAGRWELTTPNATLAIHNATGVGPGVVLTASILEGTPEGVAFGSVSLNGTDPLVHASQIDMEDKTNRVGLLSNGTLVTDSGKTDYEEKRHVAVKFRAVAAGGNPLLWEQAAKIPVLDRQEAPIAGSVSANTTQSNSIDLDVIGAAVDPEGDIINLTGTPTLVDPTQGTVSIVNGKLRFIPAEALKALPDGAKQSVTINYQITDGTTTVNATAAVNVIGTNDAPRFDVAYNTVLPKTSGNDTVINGTDILAEVTDIDDSRGFAVTDFFLNGSTTVPEGTELQYRITNTTPWTTMPALGGEAFVLPEAAQLRVVTNGTTVGNVTIKARAYDGGKSATLEPLPSEPGGTSHFSGGDEAVIIQPLEAATIVPPVTITTTGPVSYSDWADNAGNSKNPIDNNMNISGLQPGKNYTFSLELTAYAKSGGGYSGFYPFTIPSGSALNDRAKFSFTEADNVRTYTFYGTPEQFDAVLPDMHITGFICFQTNFQATCSGSFDIANAQIQLFTFKIDDAGKVTSTTLTITSDPALVGGRRMEALAAAHTQLAPSNMSDKVSTAPATAAAVLRLWQEAEAASSHKAAAVSKGVG